MNDATPPADETLDPQQLLLQIAALREALHNVGRVTTDYWRRIYIVPALDVSCPPAERILLDAHRWRVFWQIPLRDRRTLILHERLKVEERLDTLEAPPAMEPSVVSPSMVDDDP